MEIPTGKTIYEQVLSLDYSGNPVTGVTFDSIMYRNGSENTGTTINITPSDLSRGLYTASWSADTTGDYQMYLKNNTTSVVFVSDVVTVKSDQDLGTVVYVGL